MATSISTPNARYIGITDDCIECQCCGKAGLRSTVVIALLDADGNTEEITYYGSTCAARALSVRGGGRAVLQSARWAQEKLALEAADARKMLQYYGLPEAGIASGPAIDLAAIKYADAHANAVWAPHTTWNGWRNHVLDMLARKQSTIAEAALVGA